MKERMDMDGALTHIHSHLAVLNDQHTIIVGSDHPAK